MSKTRTFVSGVALGMGLAVATAYAADLKRWTPGALVAANEIVGERSGLRFFTPPPDPDRPATLLVAAAPVAGLTQVIAVGSPPPDPESPPPDPDFRAVLNPPPDPESQGTILLQISHPEDITITGPDGTAQTLCPAVSQLPG